MPAKSKSQQRQIACLQCGAEIEIKCQRDLTRKKFCSRSCSSKYHGERRYRENPDFYKRFAELSNSDDNRTKKGLHGAEHPNWKGGVIPSVCNWCGEGFTAPAHKIKEGNGRYCSRVCFEAWQSSGAKIGTNMKERHRIICKLCQKEFFVQPCKKDSAKYCSMQCHNIGNHIFAKKINKELLAKSYIILRFWEHEINGDPDYVKASIKSIIEREKCLT